MTNIKTMMEEMAQEELERDGAACVEVMKHRKKNADGDLISRKALIAEYDRVHVGAPGGARKLMADAPAVDAVPVVRCKDCIHAKPVMHRGEPLEDIFKCTYLKPNTNMFDIDYCRYGKRRK